MKVLLLSLKTHSHMVYFNLGLAYLVAAFRTVGIEPDLALLDAGRMNRDDLRKQLQENSYDFVGMGFLFDNLPRVLEYMELISSASPDSKVLIGGPGPSSCPEYMLKKTGADILVQGEAEMIVPHLFTNLPEAGHSYTTKGIYWRIGDEVFTNGPGEIYMNLNDIPQPAWDAFPMQDYLKTARPPATTEDMYMPVLTSRGCPYNCNFCYHTNKFRYRDADKIAQEIVLLQERYGVTFVQFYDDLFMSSKKRCLELCDAFKRYDIDFRYRINGRVNIVD